MPRVIVVDDQAEKRAALVAALMGAGFDALAVASCEAASVAREYGAQIAIIDLMLHGTNGFELARELRDRAPDVGVILTSDYHFSPTQLEKMDCGAIAFVPRPFALPELAEFLRTKMESRPDSTRRPAMALS
jgi:DNA-binding response OmpR family regulator